MNTNPEKGDERRQVGFRGEDLAAQFYEENGWQIVDRNVEFDAGELDLIVKQYEFERGEAVPRYAFVEVKTRRGHTDMPPGANLTRKKRRKIVTLAKIYRKMHPKKLDRAYIQIDVLEVDLSGAEPEIEHFPAAIDASGRKK